MFRSRNRCVEILRKTTVKESLTVQVTRFGMIYGGTAPELIEDDVFCFVVKVPQFDESTEVGSGIVTPQVAPQVTPEVTPEVAKVLSVLREEMTRSEIMGALGLKDEKNFREKYQQAGLAAGLMKMTIPDKPNSRLQKYRVTKKGTSFLKKTDVAEVTPQVTPEVTPEVTPQVLAVLKEAEKIVSASQLQKAAGFKDRVYFLKSYLSFLLSSELLERTIPNKPNSRLQKYRLTQKGKHLLENQ